MLSGALEWRKDALQYQTVGLQDGRKWVPPGATSCLLSSLCPTLTFQTKDAKTKKYNYKASPMLRRPDTRKTRELQFSQTIAHL